MDPSIEFTNNLFDQFTLNLSSYTEVGEQSISPQHQSSPGISIENITLEQNIVDVSGADDLLTADIDGYNSASTLQIGDISFISQSILNTPLSTPTYCTPIIHPHKNKLEEFLTPLVSPATTPNFTDVYQLLDSNPGQYFTPLSSPVLFPNHEEIFYLSDRLNQLNNGSGHLANTAPANVNVKEIHSYKKNTITEDSGMTETDSNTINKAPSTADDLITDMQDPTILAQQQILRDQVRMPPLMPPNYRKIPLGLYSSRHQNPPSPLPFNSTKKRTSLHQQIVLASPKLQSTQHRLKPRSPSIQPARTPATPASLMKIGQQPDPGSIVPSPNKNLVVDVMPALPPAVMPSTPLEPTLKKRKLAPLSPSSPRALRPLISPFLPPSADTLLSLNTLLPSVEIRRSAHKVAEQRRRDTLKQSFDSLRNEIVKVLIEDSGQPAEVVRKEKEKQVKLMSKVLLLQHSYEYIIRLKTDSQIKDDKIRKMQEEIDKLKQQKTA